MKFNMRLRPHLNTLLINQYLFVQKNIVLFFGVLLISTLSMYSILWILEIKETTRFLFQLIISRGFLLIWLLLFVIQWLKIFLKDGVELPNSSFNLAVFRIIFFAFFAIGGIFAFAKLKAIIFPWIDIPISNRSSFFGLYQMVNFIPVNDLSVWVAVCLFVISAWGAFLGFKTRLSIFLFAVSAFYIFGVPNLFGKVNHTHHIFWIPLILLFSDCSDQLSIDAHLRNKEVKVCSNEYAPPFILLWIFMGLIYFFPGFWKLWDCGFDWALTSNLRDQMHLKWISLGGWNPIIRLDNYPFIYKSGALFTVFFELSFILLVMQIRIRPFIFIAGILFHVACFLFMKIFFVVLLIAYASVINWEKLLCGSHSHRTKIYWRRQNIYEQKKITLLGFVLVFGFISAGLTKTNSWPFACYPTFAHLVGNETSLLVFEEKLTKGGVRSLNNQKLIEKYSPERFRYWEYEVIELHNKGLYKEMDIKIKELIELWRMNDAAVNPDSIAVYIKNVSIDPEKTGSMVKVTRLK